MADDDKVFDEFEQYCDEINKAAALWAAKWPNACKKCYGRGGTSYIEMHGFKYGSGEQMYDICECSEAGNCPRCGYQAWPADPDQEETPCSNCGWNWCKGSDDACPEV